MVTSIGRLCDVPDCGKKAHCHGYCPSHYPRWRKYGDPLAGQAFHDGNIHDRFFQRVQVDSESACWIWLGAKTPRGYGKMSIGGGRLEYTHRVSYLLFFADIPDGLQLDHLCSNPPCCNPEHLEPVTSAANILRGVSPSANNARKTHCPHGHLYDLSNTKFGKSGQRYCEACMSVRGVRP